MPIDVALARRVLDPRVFELIVLPTEQCNFRCTYCYEDFMIGRMSTETVTGLKRLISSRADGTSDLVLSWFGGEPLLASDIVLELSHHAQSCLADCGRNFVSHITTNAYRLDLNLFRRLLDAGVRRYQITLDGPRDVHDRTRKRRDGGRSFDKIWSNLLSIRDVADQGENFQVSLRLHYDGRSAALIEPLICEIERSFGERSQFSVNLHAIERLGGPRDEEIADVAPADAAVVRDYAARLAQAGLSTVVPAEGLDDYICYAAKANSLIVRANGRLSKCTVALRDEYNDIGQLRPDGQLEIDNSRLQPWLRGLFSGSLEELQCPNVGFPQQHRPTVFVPLESIRSK